MENSSNSSQLHTKLQLVADDVRFLKKQFHQAAKTKMDLYLPEMDEEDSVRKRVQELVSEFITETFEMSRHAMIVDGQDMTDHELGQVLDRDNDVEPFDLELNDKLRQLYAAVDEKTLEVTELRRTIPFQAIQKLQSSLQEDEKIHQQLQQEMEKEMENEDQQNMESMNEIPSRTVEDYKVAINNLQTLKQSVPDEYIELDKLQQTIDYFNLP